MLARSAWHFVYCGWASIFDRITKLEKHTKMIRKGQMGWMIGSK